MKRAAIILAVALAALLTGCTAAPASAPSSSTGGATAAPSSTTKPSAAPLVAETPGKLSQSQAEAAFLTQARDRLSKIRSQIPNATDEQLLSAAAEGCRRLDAGESGQYMTVIQGETTTNGYYMDSGAIITAARMTICPAK